MKGIDTDNSGIYANLNRNNIMRYISTNGATASVSIGQALTQCVCADGGLFVPEHIPQLPRAFFNNMSEMNLREIAYVVASAFFAEDIDGADIKKIVEDSFSIDIPIRKLTSDIFIMELFHGATLTFKDFGARFMARLLTHFDNKNRVSHRTVVVASTGNSAAASANGMLGLPGVKVIILFPKGGLSRMQMSQFVTLGSNIHPIEIDGTIEDCKTLAAAAITDPALADWHITGGNSINIGRLLPQIVFAFHAYSRLVALGCSNADKAIYSIPCGNMSNLIASVIAHQMGLPMGPILGVCNVNDSLGRAIRGEELLEHPLPTLAPSMDISKPTGLERLRHLCKGNIANEVTTVSVSDRDIASAVLRVRAEQAYSIDPHGAAALSAANTLGHTFPKVIFATAHPAKNLDIMTRITGSTIELPVQLMRFMEGKRVYSRLPASLPALRRLLLTIK